jgi:hypothetical protein
MLCRACACVHAGGGDTHGDHERAFGACIAHGCMASDRHACRLRSPGLSVTIRCRAAWQTPARQGVVRLRMGREHATAVNGAWGALARLSPSRPQGRPHYLSSPWFGDEDDVSQWAVAWVDGCRAEGTNTGR